MGKRVLTSFTKVDIAIIRNELVEEILKLLGKSSISDSIIWEIKIPISELATNALEHGECCCYCIVNNPVAIGVIFLNRIKENHTLKEKGEGEYGLEIVKEYSSTIKPKIKNKSLPIKGHEHKLVVIAFIKENLKSAVLTAA